MLINKINGIYAITPNKKIAPNIIENIIIQNKISVLQYRRKISDQNTKFIEALQIQLLCIKHNTLFIINDDISLTKELAADGIHLGKKDITISEAREKLGPKAIIGISCYNDLNRAIKAQKLGANYVSFGAVFTSKTKPDAVHCPLKLIRKAKKIINIPIVAIGGINFNNKQQAIAAGCNAVAMINHLFI